MRKAFPLYVQDNFPNDGELRKHVIAKVESPNYNDGMSLTPMYSNISTTESHPHVHVMLKNANAVSMLHGKLFKGNKSLTDRLTDVQADMKKSEKLFDERRDGRLMRAIKAAVTILTIGQVDLSTSSIFKAKSRSLIGGIQNLLLGVNSGPTYN